MLASGSTTIDSDIAGTHITGTREVAEGVRPALPPVVVMLTFTLTEVVGITVAGDKEHFAPMGRFAHVNVKL